MLAVAQETWLGIVGALVPSLLALIAAAVGFLNRAQLKTSNGKSVGTMVEEVHGKESMQGTTYETHS